jgi:hypothetical protein
MKEEILQLNHRSTKDKQLYVKKLDSLSKSQKLHVSLMWKSKQSFLGASKVGGHKERVNEGEYGRCILYLYMKIE